MKDTIVPLSAPAVSSRTPSWNERLFRKAVLARLEGLPEGSITFRDADGAWTVDPQGPQALCATVEVADPAFYRMAALGGGLGAAEAYIRGYWRSSDLTALFRILARSMTQADRLEAGLARLTEPFARLWHFLRRNTRRGSAKNIHAHYDLGNDFYRLFLDETMTYSCGIFERPGSSLKDASVAKIDRLCRKLELGPQDHLLEIGTGWGALAIHAARNYGCRVTTTTISREQFALASERVRKAGLEDRVRVLDRDYRELDGVYDKLVSVEMIEAVGHHYFDAFFAACSRLLKPDGMMALQAITVVDHYYGRARRSVDYIKRYIFPGSCIPSVTAMLNSIARRTDLRLFHLEDITPHYAKTLRVWWERFRENVDEVRALGYPESFIRMWEYYLCYCEAGFAERHIGDVQMLLTKPRCRREPILPELSRPQSASAAA